MAHVRNLLSDTRPAAAFFSGLIAAVSGASTDPREGCGRGLHVTTISSESSASQRHGLILYIDLATKHI
jgi:hypothetical protein